MLCYNCPRMCGIDRRETTGFCGMPEDIVIARAALHFWEEPCISGKRGSGTVFFSGCSLRCIFCQNSEISTDKFGKKISVERLSEIMHELEEKGAHNINFVTPTHYVHAIKNALDLYRPKIPIVYNCGGYENPEIIKSLEGYIDIYLPDFKYFSSELSSRLSSAPDYFEKASAAIKEMCRQTGKAVFNEDGIMQKGTLIRHLVLPSHKDDSIKILEWMKENLPNKTPISLMRQYTPINRNKELGELRRKLTSYEYDYVLNYMIENGMTNGFMQEKESAEAFYTPPFDLTGV